MCAIANNAADQRIEKLRVYCRKKPRKITPRNNISSSTGAPTQANNTDTTPGAISASYSAMSSASIGNTASTIELTQPASNTRPGTSNRIGTLTTAIVAVTECLAGWNSAA